MAPPERLDMHQPAWLAELRGGLEAAIQGFSTSIGPVLLFLGLFGSQALPSGLWATLITASAVHAVHIALRSHPSVIPSSRVASLAAFASLALTLAHATPEANQAGRFVSLHQFQCGLLAASALYLLASVTVLISGLLRWGNVVKMIPTPVTSGISNGTALLLVWLALRQILDGGIPSLMVGAAMMAAFLFWPAVQLRWPALNAVPAALFSAALGIVLTLVLEPAHPASHIAARMVTNTPSVPIFQWQSLGSAEIVRLILIGLPGAITLSLIMVLETFTCIGVMETRYNLKVDANRELVALGGANIVSALIGGVPNTGSPIRSVASFSNGGRTHLAGGIAIVLTTGLALALADWLVALPLGMVAGLFLMQATLLVDRKFLARAREMLTRRKGATRSQSFDHAFWLSLSIALVAFFGNLIWACFMGLVLSCLVVLRRLSGRLTARWAYLDHYRSRRMRNAKENDALASCPHGVAVLRLNGHLFFGNSPRLVQLADELHADTFAVVVDVSQVADVDPSALDALQWLLKALVAQGHFTVLAGLSRTRRSELRAALADFAQVRNSPDLDRAMETCEDALLDYMGVVRHEGETQSAIDNQLLQGLSPDELTSVLLLSEEREVAQGQPLFLRDTPADGVWLLQSGRVSILFNQDPTAARLATFGPGQFIGEMGFVDGKTRSASAMADTPVRALLIDNQAFQALREQHPLAVVRITTNIARELSQRVRQSSALAAHLVQEDGSDWENSSLAAPSRF